MVQSITKPWQLGGISHICIPVPNPPNEPTWESIYDPQVLEHHVLQQHRTHFSQSAGIIFTQEPLQTLVNDMSKYAQQILTGTADIDSLPVDKYTKDLLNNLKSKVQPNKNTQQPLDMEALIKGFKTWPKQTSTLPLGRH